MVGYGDIGQETANLARAFKMSIIALRRRKELSQHDKDLGLKVIPPNMLQLQCKLPSLLSNQDNADMTSDPVLIAVLRTHSVLLRRHLRRCGSAHNG